MLCLIAAWWSFHNPKAVLETANAGISSISVISGISIALTSLLAQSQRPKSAESFEDAQAVFAISTANRRVLFRQRIFISISILSILAGLLFIAVSKANSSELVTSLLSACYSFLLLSSLIGSIFTALALTFVTERSDSEA